MDRADFHNIPRLGSVDHLTSADVDAAVVIVRADVARLGIAHLTKPHERAGGVHMGLAAGECVAHETRAVVGVRPGSTPRIGLAELAVRAVDDRIAR